MRSNAITLAVLLAFSLAFASPYGVVPMTYNALAADSYRLAVSPGDIACAPTSSGDLIYQNAKLIAIKSTSSIFGGPGDAMSGDYVFSRIMFDPIGLTTNGSTSLNGTYFQSTNTDQWAPRVFWKVPGRDCYNWNDLTYMPTSGYNEMIGVPIANTNSTLQGAGFWFSKYYYSGLPSGIQTIFFTEFAGSTGPNTEMKVTTAIPFIANNPNFTTIRFKPSNNSTSILYYRGIMTSPNFVSYEPVFITERGSRWNSVGTTDVSAQVATKTAKPSFVFRTSQLPFGGTTWPQYTFETLITDTVDRTTKNRQNTLPEDEYPALLSSPDTGGAITSPLRAVEPGTARAKNLNRIGGSEYAPFADFAVVDFQAPSGFAYTEKQSYWAGSTQNAVAYDSGTVYRDIIVNKYSAMASSAKFEGNDFGIPVCTGDLNPNMTDDWTSCQWVNGVNSFTDRHRVKIMYLNEEWTISSMAPSTTPLASQTDAVNGGTVKLADEDQYGILTINGTLTGAQFSVRLADVASSPTCNYGEYPAIYDILDANNSMVGQIMNCPGNTYTFMQPGTSNKVMFHTYKTGTSGSMEWAETAIYAKEIVLKDGMRYNLVSSTDPDKNFKVSLLWKNRDYTGAGSSTAADSLREIVVYQIDEFEKTPRMGVYNFLNSQPAFRLAYAGITIMSNIGPAPTPLPIDSAVGSETITKSKDTSGKEAAQENVNAADSDEAKRQ